MATYNTHTHKNTRRGFEYGNRRATAANNVYPKLNIKNDAFLPFWLVSMSICWLSLHFPPSTLAHTHTHNISCSQTNILHYFPRTFWYWQDEFLYSIENNNLWTRTVRSNRQANEGECESEGVKEWNSEHTPYQSAAKWVLMLLLLLHRYHDYGTIFAYEWLNWIKNLPNECAVCCVCVCERKKVHFFPSSRWLSWFLCVWRFVATSILNGCIQSFSVCTGSMLTRSDIEFITICGRRLWCYFIFTSSFFGICELLTLRFNVVRKPERQTKTHSKICVLVGVSAGRRIEPSRKR